MRNFSLARRRAGLVRTFLTRSRAAAGPAIRTKASPKSPPYARADDPAPFILSRGRSHISTSARPCYSAWQPKSSGVVLPEPLSPIIDVRLLVPTPKSSIELERMVNSWDEMPEWKILNRRGCGELLRTV